MSRHQEILKKKLAPHELHRALGIRKKCEQCGAPAAIRIKVLVALDELTRRAPEYVANIMASNPDGPFVPTIETKYGPMVKTSDIGACDNCRVEAEKAAAKGPSWAIVEIDRQGLSGSFPIVAQVPGFSEHGGFPK